MAKTCGDCEKCSYEAGFENYRVFERYRCSVTGQVNDPDHPCDVLEKPRLCEVLGVDVGERFKVRVGDGDVDGPFFIRDDGRISCPVRDIGALDLLSVLVIAINHPEKIVRLPRLTPEEIQRCKAFGAKWVGRDTGSPPEAFWAILFSGQPRMGQDGLVLEKETYIGAVRADLFPSVGLGDLIQVEDEPSEGAAGQ